MSLTDLKIRSLKAQAKIYKVFDGSGRGLYLEVFPNGSKLWRVKFRTGGQEKRKALGAWPDVSLRQARETVDALRVGLRNGVIQLPKTELTVEALFQEWKTKFFPSLAPATVKKCSLLYGKHIFPSLGELPVGSITPVLLLERLFRPIEQRGHLDLIKAVKSKLSQIFRYAVATGRMERDPTQDLNGAFPPAVVRHMPAILDKPRIGRLLSDIFHYQGQPSTVFALRILPYVFTRPGELRNAEWSEINFEDCLWRIPSKKMKMRAGHTVPLASQVAEQLAELRKFTGGGRYLFPGVRSKDKPISDVTLTAALRYLGYSSDEIVPHGFRSMASTLLNELGYNPDWIEKQLAHVSGGVRAVYNRSEYLPERRRMMQEWADFLDGLKNGVTCQRGQALSGPLSVNPA
ncbi:MAG: tyrosine-type recombinase/integrase [Deltaproteobacteria bacterium]|jgi:integrase|nr:tyrosine-type recombinase/integrase [Deltaproteobacteria bacterium]